MLHPSRQALTGLPFRPVRRPDPRTMIKRSRGQEVRKMASPAPVLHPVSLDDKYALEKGRAYLTGIEALVRLPIMQHQRDLARGLDTAGFISGYRGSPVAGLDTAMWRAGPWLDEHNIHFNPGVNEELAATAVWGSQQTNLFAGAPPRWRLRHVVRQGPRRRPERRCLQARQCCRHVALRRGAGHRRGRSRRQVVDPAPPVGTRVHRRLHTGTEPGQCSGGARSRHLRLGTVALQRLLGRRQGHYRQHGLGDFRRYRPRPHPHRRPGSVRTARGRRASALAGLVARTGSQAEQIQDLCRAGVRARQRPEPGRHRQPQSTLRHHHHRQGLPGCAAGTQRPRA